MVSTLRDLHANRVLLHAVQTSGYHPRMVLAADTPSEAARVRERGADEILVAYSEAALGAADRIVGSGGPLPRSESSGDRADNEGAFV